tara:strand:+ start:2611 stop:3462 length:852 start_codon:yes stop_codon:yes gene_type:complete
MHTIGIVGNGYVGGATSLLCRSSSIDGLIYDKDEEKCSHNFIQLSDLAKACEFIFVCVPTPMNPNGSCVTMYVEMVVLELLQLGYDAKRIIVKSTVPVGTCRRLGVMFMPEFLTEKNWEKDFLNQQLWILGDNERNDKIRNELYSIFELAWKSEVLKNRPEMFFSSTEEAELTKYARNCFLATKVSFFNELNSFCEAKDMDYEKVAKLVTLDSRINKSHTQVPGPDGKKGFGGTCFPKDMSALEYQFVKAGVNPHIIRSSICRNNTIDRTEKDWKNNKGRAVL